MKTTILQEDFLQGLTTISRFVASRAQLPVLSNVLIATQKGKLKLSATNLEMGVSFFVGAKTQEEGSITVPAKILLDLVSSFPPGQLFLETEQEKLLVKTSSFSVVLGGISASEFPLVLDESKNQTLFVSNQEMTQISKKVIFSSSRDDSRPILTGVLFVFGEKGIKMVATDGFRLSLTEIPTQIEGMKGEKILIPARIIEELSRILAKDEQVGLSVLNKEKQIVFSTNSVVLTGRLLEGEFPNYERIIPKEWTYRAYIGKDELTRAIRASGVIARESSGVIKIDFRKDGLLILAENQQYGKEEVLVEARTEGEGLKVAFNYKYILDFLTSASGEEVLLETAGNAFPAVFRDANDSLYLHLIMPVRLQDQ